MKTLLLLTVILTAILIFNSDSYSQSDCNNTAARCCDEKNVLSGGAQPQLTDSIKSETSGTAVCPVSKEKFKSGSGKKISYLGKQYEFCCEGCEAEFRTEPIGYTGGIATCSICNDDDGKADISMVYEDTKYYFCNENCKTKFSKNPEKILEKYNR